MSNADAYPLPRYTCIDDRHIVTWEDGYRIELVQASVRSGRLYGVMQACHGQNILNVVDGNLLDDGTRQRFADACQRINGQVAWVPRLLYATNTVSTALRGTTASAAEIWNTRETLAAFLASTITLPEGLTKDLVFPGGMTSIAAPSGIGKSVVVLILAYELARGGVFRGQHLHQARILFLDTDNPRSLLHHRLRHICTDHQVTLEVMSRDKTPKLTDQHAWQALPAQDFDVIILDSFGAASSGVSEKEGAALQQALDTLRCVADKGPAVVMLDNTTKGALSYRGRGEKTERVDVFYEVRDITTWTPEQPDSWWESLPSGDDAQWQARASRRKKQDTIRLAFVCRKMRWGEEPDPFGVEVDFTATPWTLTDITADIVSQGQTAADATRQATQRTLLAAASALTTALAARAPEDPIGLSDAVAFLRTHGLKRNQARNLLDAYDAAQFPQEGRWVLRQMPGRKGAAIGVYPVNGKSAGGTNDDAKSASNDADEKTADFSRRDTEPAGEIPIYEIRIESRQNEDGICPADNTSLFQEPMSDLPPGRPQFARPARQEGGPR